MKKQVELSITHNGKDVVAYPYTKKEHVQFENGMNIDEFVGQDIATPTITHDTTAIKVGVGDSDVSGSVVDGTVNMTIKGQTYQNILPEPSLRNKMIGKSMQRLNEGYDDIEVVDGVSKSAILSGQTLVNICKNSGKDLICTNINSSTSLCYKIKDNTWYYLIINVKQNTLNKPFRFSGWTLAHGATPMSGSEIGTSDKDVFDVGETGVKRFKIGYSNIPEDKGKTLITFVADSSTVTGQATYDIMLLEYQDGMENWDIPYFEGMQSVKMPVLKTTGKNLCKYRSDWVNNGLTFTHTNDGVTVNGTATAYVDYYVTTKSGLINVETIGELNRLQVGTRLFLSNNLGKNSYISYTLNGETKYANNVTIQNGMKIIGALVRFQQGDICNNLNLTIQLEIGNEATPYEPHKSNILSTSEDVTLRGIGEVRDTLDCLTGEVTERIGEIVFDGSEDENWHIDMSSNNVTRLNMTFKVGLDNIIDCDFATTGMLCDRFIQVTGSSLWVDDVQGIGSSNGNSIKIGIPKSNLTTQDVNGFKTWLSQNHVTVQYQLKTPTIKTVDLSSSGNWEKVVLDGSENWSMTSESSNNNAFFRGDNTVPNNVKVNSNNLAQKVICDILTPFTQDQICNKPNDFYGISLGWNDSNLCVRHKDFPLTNEGLTQWKQYLQQNPVTVWYQTTTTQDNSIREMLSFANGHLQVSSEAENSLLPSVQYEIPTKNSYHMDLMKTNTLYTMKAKTVSGTFTIDGTSYNVNANGTFTSPSSMTDKLLIMSNKTNEEVMLLEGNVIDKTIPHFKGIKSAFEGEDKIEVLSNSGNLANYLESSFAGGSNLESTNANNELTLIDNTNISYSFIRTPIYKDFVFKKGRKYHVEFEYVITNVRYGQVKIVTPNVAQITNSINFPISNNWSKFKTTLTPILDFSVNSLKHTEQGVETCLEFMALGGEELSGDKTLKIRNVILSEDDIDYKPYKQNVSKIPLLHPLRSLPNGVCDELIIDRLNHKAKLIQRVGVVLASNFSHNNGQDTLKTSLFSCPAHYPQASGIRMCDRFLNYETSNLMLDTLQAKTESEGLGSWSRKDNFNFRILTSRLGGFANNNTMSKWLKDNPTTILYHLKTPIITEIDLEGYPYAYKDGHIFLNSDIAPTTQITYSINQAQQIESANENLQRHEKEISRLQKLIAQYIQVEYVSTLLSLKI